jgi:hypothetical protein
MDPAHPHRRQQQGDIMALMTFLILAAMLGVVGSLAFGVAAMAIHGQVGHRSSADWMTMRVAFQALAVVLILVTLSS